MKDKMLFALLGAIAVCVTVNAMAMLATVDLINTIKNNVEDLNEQFRYVHDRTS